MTEARVLLPPGIDPPFTVYVNGVRQQPGADYEVTDGVLSFRRPLAKEGRLGFWKWFWGAFGIGSYGRNDVVDVAHAGGLAHDLPLEPPAS